ncbi:MAG: tRNA (N6-threonylcarbamoyladenosine(37)-N6)-methyltransferase TrmO [Actinomycetota bacterium]|jgi:tRNA-Thr(GGU) m(6)t(6)A37 methyltransferase TsaA|nr:tRNA (N6-threonylcarbamoyladenosine(37)-N6)-methyltransferase TrmO [Rubrobacter sp.]MDQ3509959.1 tRNA (N6-threonylcarbamoyladenosine(37)-N6)-methyltransferase TrmO [Actinomycetota bacterium]
MSIEMNPIGHVETEAERIPRSWRSSDLEGDLIISEEYAKGLAEIEAGDRIVVLFNFHQSPPFSRGFLRQNPRSAGGGERGVFKTLSPVRPNAIGMSIVEVIEAEGSTLRVRGMDMRDGTPILDIKPWRGDLPGSPVFEK